MYSGFSSGLVLWGSDFFGGRRAICHERSLCLPVVSLCLAPTLPLVITLLLRSPLLSRGVIADRAELAGACLLIETSISLYAKRQRPLSHRMQKDRDPYQKGSQKIETSIPPHAKRQSQLDICSVVVLMKRPAVPARSEVPIWCATRRWTPLSLRQTQGTASADRGETEGLL